MKREQNEERGKTMSITRKLLFPVVLLLVVGLAATAFAADVLLVAKDQEAVGFDPHKVPAHSSIAIYSHIYEGLVTTDEEGYIIPILAESWVTEDDTTYTFTLRQGVKFHNGREMTSDDVKYSFERIMDPETASIAASYFINIAEILTPDKYTVTFKLSDIQADFLLNLSNVNAAIVPQEVVEEHGDLNQVLVGTGPFVFSEWVPDNYTSLLAFEDYWEPGVPMVDELRFIIMKDEAARIAAIRTGAVHISSISPEAATLLRNTPNADVIEYPTLNYLYWGFNTTKPPFDDARVRLAMSYAIDRQVLIDVVYQGQAILTGPVPASNVAWAVPIDSFPSYVQDQEKAKALLAEAGYADGLSFKIKTSPTYPDFVDLALTIQHQLSEIGVDVEIELVEWGAYIDAWVNMDHDSMIGNNGGGTTPDRSLYFFFHTEGTANVWGFSNPVLDELTERARRTVDMEERWEIYAQGQRLVVNEEAPNLFLAVPNQFYAVSKAVDGFTPSTLVGTRLLRYTYFK